jgi:hypothetical protein
MAGKSPPKFAIIQLSPVAVARSPGGNQMLENLVTHEKNTTPVNPVQKNDP